MCKHYQAFSENERLYDIFLKDSVNDSGWLPFEKNNPIVVLQDNANTISSTGT